MKTPRQGPTPVGDRLRATTIPSKKNPGPTVDEYDRCPHEWRFIDSRNAFYCRICKSMDDAQ